MAGGPVVLFSASSICSDIIPQIGTHFGTRSTDDEMPGFEEVNARGETRAGFRMSSRFTNGRTYLLSDIKKALLSTMTAIRTNLDIEEGVN